MSKAIHARPSRRDVTNPHDITTWSLPRIIAWLMSCEAHFQARRVIAQFRPGHDGVCVCNTCVSRRSSYGK